MPNCWLLRFLFVYIINKFNVYCCIAIKTKKPVCQPKEEGRQAFLMIALRYGFAECFLTDLVDGKDNNNGYAST